MALPKLRAGDLKHRIKIKRSTLTPDGKGGFTKTWPVIAQPWAEVIGLDGRESVIARSLQGVSSYRIRIRYRGDIKPADQIQYGAIELNLRSAVDPNGDREQLLILADTGSAEATG